MTPSGGEEVPNNTARVVALVEALRDGEAATNPSHLLGALQQLGDLTSDRQAGDEAAAAAAAGAIPPLVTLVSGQHTWLPFCPRSPTALPPQLAMSNPSPNANEPTHTLRACSPVFY